MARVKTRGELSGTLNINQMPTNMLHIHGHARNRPGVARWLSGWRRIDHALSEHLEVEAGRTQHAATSQSRARAGALPPTDCGLPYGHADLRLRFEAAHAYRCQTLLSARPKTCEPNPLGQATTTPHFGDVLCRGALRPGCGHAVSRDEASECRSVVSVHRDRPEPRSAPALHRRATRDRIVPAPTPDAWESAAKLDGAGHWPSSREGSETSG